MNRRREQLGRNRAGPARRHTMTHLLAGVILLGSLGYGVYRFLTTPQRVYGVKNFDCGVTEIEWESANISAARSPLTYWNVSGCGQEEIVRCSQAECRPATEPFPGPELPEREVRF